MKQSISILAFLILVSTCFGQDFKIEFDKYCQEGDTSKQLEILQRWEKQEPEDAELFTSYFNYYFSRSRKEILSLTNEQPEGESLAFHDSTGTTAGYIGSQLVFDPNEVEKGFSKIDRGIMLYPDRLDMRFGKIYVLGQVKDWTRFTHEIVKTVQHSAENSNQWTWTNNEETPNGKEFFLSSLQDYQLTLYNTGDNSLLENMRTIANEILKYYPDHVESLSNLSITYLLTGEYDKGLEPLLKATKVDPTDVIILSNIAQGYKLKGNKEKAIEYYEKTIEYADERTATYARQQISELSK